MNFFGNHRSSHQHSPPSIAFSMGMPSLPTSSQQQVESLSSPSSTPSSSTLNHGTSSTTRDRPSNGNPSPEIELVTPQSSTFVVKTNILPEFSIDYESDDDDDTFEDVEFGGSNTPTTSNGSGSAEREMNQQVTRRFHAPQWIPTNIVQLGMCIGIVIFIAVAVIAVVVMSSNTVSSPAATTTTTASNANANAAIAAATGSTLYHNVTHDSVWTPPPGNSTRRGLRHLHP